jgi:hypothetical protein
MSGYPLGKSFGSKIARLFSSQTSPVWIPRHSQILSFYTYQPMKMEQTECSETSAYKIQAPGNYPEENIQNTPMLSARIVYLYAPYEIQSKLTLHTHIHIHIHTCHWLIFLTKTHCVRCQIGTESLYITQTGCSLQLGRSSLPSKALVRSRNSTCTIYGGQSAPRRVFFFRVRWVSPVTIILFNAPHSFTHLPLMIHTQILDDHMRIILSEILSLSIYTYKQCSKLR